METESYHWWNHQWYEHNIIDSQCIHMFSNAFSVHMVDGSTDGGALLSMMLFGAPRVFSWLFHFTVIDYSCLHVRNWIHSWCCFPYYRNRAMEIL